MKFFVDENTSPAFSAAMKFMFPQHEFEHCNDAGLSGAVDTKMIRELSARGEVDVLITKDVNQWSVAEEQREIRASCMSWLAHRDPPFSGPRQVSFLTAAYLSAIDLVTAQISTTGRPVYARVNHVPHDPTQRVKFFA